jgi:hypothetical protein
MTELEITLDVLQRLHRDIENNSVQPANRIGVAKHALDLADKCDRLSTGIPEVAVIRQKLLALFPKPQEEVIPAPAKKARKKPS